MLKKKILLSCFLCSMQDDNFGGSGGKSTENLYSSTSTVTLLKYYSTTSKSTGV